MTDRPFRFTVHATPPRSLGPNRSRKLQDFTIGAYKDAWRSAWDAGILQALAREQGGNPATVTLPTEPIYTEPVSVFVLYFRSPRAHEWDGDNLIAVCKAGIDVLQSRKIVANDRLCRFEPVFQDVAGNKRGRVEVIIDPHGPGRMVRLQDAVRNVAAALERYRTSEGVDMIDAPGLNLYHDTVHALDHLKKGDV